MNHWLLKTDPETYSFADLAREKRTVWDGVRNNQALIYLRQMKTGDRTMIYHSGGDKFVAGLAEIARGAYPDPAEQNDKLVVIDVRAKRALPNPIPLAQIKADPAFSQFALVRISRLSVMPVSDELWRKLLAMGGV